MRNLKTATRRETNRRPSTALGLFSSKWIIEVEQDYPMLCFCEDHNRCRCTGPHKGRLPVSKMLLFGLPYFGWYSLSFFKKGTMKPFYTDDYPRASLGYIAFFSVVGVIVDAFTDPFMARTTDNARPRCWGRRRPFVLVGGFMAIVVFVLSYTPVVPSGVAASIWFGVFHIGTKLADTVLLIPLAAWGAEMTPNVNERSKLWTTREVFMTLGILFGSVLPVFVKNLGDIDCTESPATGCIGFPLLAFAFGLACFFGCLLLACLGTERPNDRLPATTKKSSSGRFAEDAIVPTLISTWLNRPFRFLIVSDVAEAFGGYLPFVVLPYFTRVVIGDACMDPTSMFSILAGVNLISRLLMLPVWVWAGRRYGKFKTYLAFNFMLAATHLLFFFVGKDTESCTMLPFLLISTTLWGMVYGGSFFLRSIMADVVDYDQFLSGKRREAQYVMALEFLPKFLEVPSEAVPCLLMAYFGYIRPEDDKDLPTQPDEVVWLVRMSASLVPALSILAGAIILCFYPKEARTNEAHKALMVAIREKHSQGTSAEDPWLPGRQLSPPPEPGPNDDILAYFWPSELKSACEVDSRRSFKILQVATLKGIGLGALLLPCGIALVLVGWEDLNSDLGASVSPIGLIFLGIGSLLISFDGSRFRAAREGQKRSIPSSDLAERYNYLCRFTGAPPLSCTTVNRSAELETSTMPVEIHDKALKAPNGFTSTKIALDVDAVKSPNDVTPKVIALADDEVESPKGLPSSKVGGTSPRGTADPATIIARPNGVFSI